MRKSGPNRNPESAPAPPAGVGERSEERRLLEAARRGDTRSFGRLVESHQDRIYGLVFRLVRDPGLAEELTQDTFIKAFRSLGGFRGESRFSTWVYRIAVNLCHDHRESRGARGRSRETRLDARISGDLDPAPSAAEPDHLVEVAEVAADFQAGLDALEPIYREAFLLRHQEGLGYDEIAEVFGISKVNAKVRVHRAREAILDTLRARGYEV